MSGAAIQNHFLFMKLTVMKTVEENDAALDEL